MSKLKTDVFARRPIRTGLWIFLAIVAFYVLGDMAAGFLDGLLTGFTDSV